jgi:hypothetical protein
MRLFVLAIFMIVLCGCGTNNPFSNSQHRISGVVTDGTNRLMGVTVHLGYDLTHETTDVISPMPQETQTDSKGFYQFVGVPNGKYVITVEPVLISPNFLLTFPFLYCEVYYNSITDQDFYPHNEGEGGTL